MKEEHSIYHFYQKMINLRKDSKYGETLTFGDFEAIQTEEETLIGYKRIDDKYEMIIWVNFGNATVTLPEKIEPENILLNNRAEVAKTEILPYQALVIAKEK